jgi:hypothetical protein
MTGETAYRKFVSNDDEDATSGGVSITMADANTAFFWTNKAGWDSSVWNLADGQLPTLKVVVDESVIEPIEPVVYFEGEGTELSPYEIKTAADLAKLAELVNGEISSEAREAYRDKHYTLTANIGIADYSKDNGGWVPIGTNRAYSFRGTFDGGGYTVSGLSISRKDEASEGDYEGLFGYVYMGTVKNLKVSGKVEGWSEVGGVAGYLEGDPAQPGSAKIENCRSAVDVKCWGPFAGGIVGYAFNGAVIENCGSSGEVLGQNDNVGGIAGMVKSSGSVKNSYSTGKISAPVNRVGGIAGGVETKSTIENCYSTGAVSGADYIGGIAGKVISSTVKNSYSTGSVQGLAGELEIDGSTHSTGYTDDSGSSVVVNIELGDYVGGVAGELYFSSLSNCYSAGRVWGHKEVGGVVGTLNPGDKVENSVAFNFGVRAAWGSAGRVVGAMHGSGAVNNNYAYSGMTNGGGEPFTGEAGTDISVDEAKRASFWAGTLSWSADTWEFNEGCFPLLKNVDGQTRKVPGEFDEETGGEEIDAETGSTVTHSGGHGSVENANDGGSASEPESGSGTDPASGTDSAHGSSPVPNPEAEPDSDAAPEPEPEPEPESGSDPAPEPEPDPSPAPGAEPVTVTVPDGGSLTLPPDTDIDSATGVATLPTGGEVTLTDNETKIAVPENTTVNPATGVITIPDGGDVALADGAIVIAVPPATVIDSGSGTITVTAPEGGTVTLPVELGDESGAGVEVHVPSGSKIDAKTGVITLPDGGRIVFSVPGGEAGAYGMKAFAASPAEDISDGPVNLAFIVASGTTVSPTTGVMTVTGGGEVTLPDGTAITVEPGTTINPFTGEIVRPEAKGSEESKTEPAGSGGGCDAASGGMTGLALLAFGSALAVRRGKPGTGKPQN